MMTDPTMEALAAQLEASGDYRVLRRLPVPAGGFVPMPHMKRAVFLDVETTGLDPNVDDIIELAMVPFWYADSGRIAGVEIGGSALRPPQTPTPAEVTRQTGKIGGAPVRERGGQNGRHAGGAESLKKKK